MLGEGTVWYLSICRHKNRDGNRISEIFPASRRMVEMVLVLTATKLGVTETPFLSDYFIICSSKSANRSEIKRVFKYVHGGSFAK